MKFRPLIVSFSLLAFAGAPAYAQSQSQSQSGGSAESSGASSQGASSQSQQQQKQGEMGTSQLIDKKVTDKQGKDLGKIEDVVIDLENGKVHAAVLSFGGIMGVGDKNFAFPMSELKPGKNNSLTVNVDKQKLENAQGFAQGQWPEMDSEYWGRVGGQSSAGASQGQKQKLNLARASELEGKEVTDKSGEELGEIKDVIVDLKSGELRNIVVSVKDAGEARVQAKSLIMGTGDKLTLDMDAQQLRSQAQQSKGGSSRGGSSRDQSSGGASGGSSSDQSSGSQSSGESSSPGGQPSSSGQSGSASGGSGGSSSSGGSTTGQQPQSGGGGYGSSK